MKIIVNGEEREVPESTTVASLIRELGILKAACAGK